MGKHQVQRIICGFSQSISTDWLESLESPRDHLASPVLSVFKT